VFYRRGFYEREHQETETLGVFDSWGFWWKTNDKTNLPVYTPSVIKFT
jgi:hypothetical protein